MKPMKVVLFCGGLGTRLREHSETIPKPLVTIGNRPILWHLMQYYAHYGHREFILCLGYRGDLIRQYFLEYDARLSEDFVMNCGQTNLLHRHSDVADWSIRFVDTGMKTNIGSRLVAVKDLLKDEPMFLANYSDQLTDLPLDGYLTRFERTGATAGFLAVRPSQSFHLVQLGGDGLVKELTPVEDSAVWINGGFMALRPEVFDYIHQGEELVVEPFTRLISEGKLYSEHYTGFWKSMDTFKDKLAYDEAYTSGIRPWEVWHGDVNGGSEQ